MPCPYGDRSSPLQKIGMVKSVILKLGRGNLTEGCPEIIAQIWENDKIRAQAIGELPSNAYLLDLIIRWRSIYTSFYNDLRGVVRMQLLEISSPIFSEIEFQFLCETLPNEINNWLNCEEFRNIDQKLRSHLQPDREIRVIIETDDDQMRRFPWHLWNFFEFYSKAEVAISQPNYEQINSPIFPRIRKVRILAILGNSQGINIEADRSILTQLPNTKTEFLPQPNRQKLNESLWHEKGWQILFFAGHSQTINDTGCIYINQTDSLTIPQLKNALRTAIDRGLQLAIFNSCDGVGLAHQLADLQIPLIIVMREPVPDKIAQEFLKHFLSEFSKGKSLYLSVRAAKEKLQGLEDEFPCASWLPVIFQNPTQYPPTWETLQGKKPRDNFQFQTALAASLIATILVLGIRMLGLLENTELKAFDVLMRSRPSEGKDPRLLIITITDEDIKRFGGIVKDGNLQMSDRTLAQLLKKLQSYQPSVIGLDIYREISLGYGYTELTKKLQQNDNIIATCKVRYDNDPGIPPPPSLAANLDRVGFSDFLNDSDQTIRRHLLSMGLVGNSACNTPSKFNPEIQYSFSVKIAIKYLELQGIKVKHNPLQIDKFLWKRWVNDTAGYQQKDFRGNQILLNYRLPENLAQEISMTEVLTNKIEPNLIKDKIVLIGNTDPKSQDRHFTPYTGNPTDNKLMSGVILHAQMVSQIISAVLDKRPLLSAWNRWIEAVWIWSWATIGVILAAVKSPWRLGLAVSATLLILTGCCWILLVMGYWVPLVPSVVVAIATLGIYKTLHKKGEQNQNSQ
jgi:CHASE2 domain-containing sensor protein